MITMTMKKAMNAVTAAVITDSREYREYNALSLGVINRGLVTKTTSLYRHLKILSPSIYTFC